MAWKLRKDKLKSDEPEVQDPIASVAETAAIPADTASAAFEPLGVPLGYDLTANVSPPAEADPASMPQFVEESLPQFADEDMPHFSPSPESPLAPVEPVEDEPVTFEDTQEKEPISLGAFAPYQPPLTPDPVIDLEPMPSFDSAATPAATESEIPEPVTPVKELIDFDNEPLTFAEDDIPAVAPLAVSPEREAAAPGLVTTESETGLPRVAPFILDMPDAIAPSEPDRMHHIVLRLGNLSASYILVKDVTTIGRPDSEVQNYPDIEVEIDDGVSRRHAEIRHQDGQFYVVDAGSTNGTILNGELLTPEQPVPLHTGDRIRIGERTEMLFE